MDNDILLTYFKSIKDLPFLSKEEEYAEAVKYKLSGDMKAREKLINSNLRWAITIAKKYAKVYHVPLIDLIQEANIGLMTAVEHFDYTRNVRLISYSTFWIKQTIAKYLDTKNRIVRIPVKKEKALRDSHIAYDYLIENLNREPTKEEIANELNISFNDFEQLISMSDIGTYDTQEYDIYHDDRYNTEEADNTRYLKEKIVSKLNNLSKRERTVVYERLYKHRTLEDISFQLNTSKELIRQIENRCIAKIKRMIDAEVN
jgi:RNA polymerase sigma factor (sigma-70 family)